MTSLAPLPPSTFGHYTLVGKLGHGRLAELLLGTMPSGSSLPNLVVIKRLHRHLTGEDDFVQAFLDEMTIAVKLDHPNVVRTYDHGVIEGDYFFVMEYLEGQGLDRVMRRCLHRGVSIPTELLATIGVQALEGLHYAHELRDETGALLNVVHRDIRPQNIFITYDGVVKLLDFGIAKAATTVVQSSLGTFKGRFGYTAPEQVNQRLLDRRADLWSMGVVLWEGFAGRSLFSTKDNAPAQLAAVVDEPIPDLVDAAPRTPRAIAEVIHKALRRDRDQRYQTARAMSEQLKVASETGDGVERSEALGDFMKELFAEVITRNRSAISQCLDGKRVSGSYDVPPPQGAPSKKLRLGRETARFSRVTRTGTKEPPSSERRLYLVLALAVLAILMAAFALRIWGPW